MGEEQPPICLVLIPICWPPLVHNFLYLLLRVSDTNVTKQVLDSVAHTRVKTPTAAAELLINLMHETAVRLADLATQLEQRTLARLELERRKLSTSQSAYLFFGRAVFK